MGISRALWRDTDIEQPDRLSPAGPAFDTGLSVKLSPLLRDVDRPEDAESVATHFPGLDFSRRHAELTRGRRCQPSEGIFDAAHTGMTTVSDLTRTGIDCETRCRSRSHAGPARRTWLTRS